MKRQSIILGTFDAESHWRNKNMSTLPAIKDKAANKIVSAMDELLFPFAGDGDILVTRYKMNNSFKDYLSSIGFKFINNDKDLEHEEQIQSKTERCIFSLMKDDKNTEYYKNRLPQNSVISPYAVLPEIKEMCDKYGLVYDGPNPDIVKMVNSKIYSHQLHSRIGIPCYSRLAISALDIRNIGSQLLHPSGLLVKDAFGVSGRGNILIQSQVMLDRIVKYILSQEQKGSETFFLLEPYLNKKVDFSCQLHISKNGDYSILSVQSMINDNFNYSGSQKADKNFLSELEKKNYFTIIEKIVKEIYTDGYYGDVCVDSMLLQNGELVPIVEINARKSMGAINHALDQYLTNFSLSGNLTFLSLGYNHKIQFEEILEKLKAKDMLFKPDKGKGIMPLSSKTLTINQDKAEDNPEAVKKGRFYFSVVKNKDEDQAELINEMKDMMTSLSFKILN